VRSDFYVFHFFPVNGSQILDPGMTEDHHDDDGFTLLYADSFFQFPRYIEGKGSKAHHAGTKTQGVYHQLHVTDIENAVQFKIA